MNKDIKNIYEAYRLLNEISRKDMELVKYDRPVEDSLDESPTGLAFKVSFEVDDRNTLSIKAVDEGLNDVKNIITGCLIKHMIPEDKRNFQQKNIIKTYSAYINGTPQNPHQI